MNDVPPPIDKLLPREHHDVRHLAEMLRQRGHPLSDQPSAREIQQLASLAQDQASQHIAGELLWKLALENHHKPDTQQN